MSVQAWIMESYYLATWRQLDLDAKSSLGRLHEQIAKEAGLGGGKPRLSIIKALTNMTDQQIENLIERYDEAIAGPPSQEDLKKVEDVSKAYQRSQAYNNEEASWQWDGWNAGWSGDQAVDWWQGASWDGSYSWEAYNSGADAAKLYVGNLPADITEEALKELFSPYGTLREIHVMQGRQKHTGQSCAMVVFASSKDAESCRCDSWSDYEFTKGDGPLIVKYADDQQHKGKGKSKGMGKGKGKQAYPQLQ